MFKKFVSIVYLFTICTLVGCSNDSITNLNTTEYLPVITSYVDKSIEEVTDEDLDEIDREFYERINSKEYGLFDSEGNNIKTIKELIDENILCVKPYRYSTESGDYSIKYGHIYNVVKNSSKLCGTLRLKDFMSVNISYTKILGALEILGECNSVVVSFSSRLEDLYIDSLVKIGDKDSNLNVSYNTVLRNINLDKAEIINAYAFDNNQEMVEFKIPDNTIEIHDGAFRSCPELCKLYGGENVRYIGNGLFENNEIINILMLDENGYWYLNDDYLMSVSKLVKGDISISSKYINSDSMSSCNGITSITFTEPVEYLGNGCITNCDNLKYITFEKGIKHIGNNSIKSNINLEEINIGGDIDYIGDSSIINNENLKCINISGDILQSKSTSFNNPMLSHNDKCVKINSSLIRLLYGTGDYLINDVKYISSDATSDYDLEISNSIKFNGIYPITLNDDIKLFNKIRTNNFIINQPILFDGNSFEYSEINKLEINVPYQTVNEDGYFYKGKLKTLFLPDGITNLDIGVFTDIFDIEYIYVPDTIKKFKDNSDILYDSALKTISVPRDFDISNIDEDIIQFIEFRDEEPISIEEYNSMKQEIENYLISNEYGMYYNDMKYSIQELYENDIIDYTYYCDRISKKFIIEIYKDSMFNGSIENIVLPDCAILLNNVVYGE